MSSFRSKSTNGYAAHAAGNAAHEVYGGPAPGTPEKEGADPPQGGVTAATAAAEEISGFGSTTDRAAESGLGPEPVDAAAVGFQDVPAEEGKSPSPGGASADAAVLDHDSPEVDADLEGLRRFAEGAETEAVRVQLRAAQEQVLRGLADLENLRKRTANEVASAHKYAVESFAESLVPVLDSLELSLKVDKASVDSLREGAEATLRLLQTAFARHRLVTIEPVGERFDPNRHQAISMVPGTSVDPPVSPNHVVAVLQKGYLIHDRVIRPALVTVAQA
jgi:molecular chaperone GrpE